MPRSNKAIARVFTLALLSRIRRFSDDCRGSYIAIFAVFIGGVGTVMGGMAYDQGARANAVKARLDHCLTIAGHYGEPYLKMGFPKATKKIQEIFNVNCREGFYHSVFKESDKNYKTNGKGGKSESVGVHKSGGFITIKISKKNLYLSTTAEVIPIMNFLSQDNIKVESRITIPIQTGNP